MDHIYAVGHVCEGPSCQHELSRNFSADGGFGWLSIGVGRGVGGSAPPPPPPPNNWGGHTVRPPNNPLRYPSMSM